METGISNGKLHVFNTRTGNKTDSIETNAYRYFIKINSEGNRVSLPGYDQLKYLSLMVTENYIYTEELTDNSWDVISLVIRLYLQKQQVIQKKFLFMTLKQ